MLFNHRSAALELVRLVFANIFFLRYRTKFIFTSGIFYNFLLIVAGRKTLFSRSVESEKKKKKLKYYQVLFGSCRAGNKVYSGKELIVLMYRKQLLSLIVVYAAAGSITWNWLIQDS